MEGFKVSVPVTPRFRDTDAMGHLNNAVYVTYFEVARMAYWRALTGTRNYHEVPFILAHTTIDFRSPAFVYEQLAVGIRVSRLGNRCRRSRPCPRPAWRRRRLHATGARRGPPQWRTRI